MTPQTVTVVGISVGTFVVIAVVLSLALGRRAREQGALRVEGLARRHDAEKAALETVIRHYELLMSPAFRKSARQEIAQLKRKLTEEGAQPGEEREQLEAHTARREVELRAAEEIMAERERRLEDAIRAAGVTGDKAEPIRQAADMRALVPLIGETLKARAAEAEAIKRQMAEAEAMKQQVAELEGETVRLEMAADEARKAQAAKAEALKQQVAQAEELKRQVAELEAEAAKLEQAKAEAMQRQEEEAEAMKRQIEQAEATKHETDHLEVLASLRNTLAHGMYPTLAEYAGATAGKDAPTDAEEGASPESTQPEQAGETAQ